ncbi:hypothetical protein OG2516_18970 [Oceanicola granulosus HTCC2516]|uniref:Uncharacterized protein n=1 Tax=Oceanicola granulosus (strain ATCC BAA-861 / DSM 15982 / KCTC 12143 / HTCC2516) TaxID=314256 RepID=Q2CBS4_OCEGH|nr:hypothetical protein [Oceanicola granulosus]EAR50130.1 hypothetical protein OG2516_18970 [Oceanicola granulosus HTCC2516]
MPDPALDLVAPGEALAEEFLGLDLVARDRVRLCTEPAAWRPGSAPGPLLLLYEDPVSHVLRTGGSVRQEAPASLAGWREGAEALVAILRDHPAHATTLDLAAARQAAALQACLAGAAPGPAEPREPDLHDTALAGEAARALAPLCRLLAELEAHGPLRPPAGTAPLEERIRWLETALADSLAAEARCADRLAACEARLQGLHASTSWKLTRPVRGLRRLFARD